MLSILRTNPPGTSVSTFMDASVSLRDEHNVNIEGKPDIVFSIKTYEKIAKYDEKHIGDLILHPINLFYKLLSQKEHESLYEMYRYAKKQIDGMNKENRRTVQENIQTKVFHTTNRLNIGARMITFCKGAPFLYPDLSNVGKEAHHTKEKTFLEDDYAELTAISVMSKLMVPIWGEFVKALDSINIGPNQREKLAFDLIEPSLEEGAMERIYSKLSHYLSSLIADTRKAIDKNPMGNAQTGFILTHGGGVDDEMFESIVMATIIVKRLATYECFTKLRDGNVPNAMVYIDDGIKKTADTKIKTMRKDMTVMPRRPLPSYDTEDNSSILDHASKTSKKPIDVPILVTTAVTHWELPKLLHDTNTPIDVYEQAVSYYAANNFDVTPITQAMVASFIGTRFGGSKCLGYLPVPIYQRIVVILQIFLINHGMLDLCALASSITSVNPIDVGVSGVSSRVMANLKSAEYHRCNDLFKGFVEKPVNTFGKKTSARKQEVNRIDFINHINKMAEWLIHYSHKENMAPALWEFSGVSDRPMLGTECKFDENTLRNLCNLYLILHDGTKPF